MKAPIVVDTNVVVAGLLSGEAESPVRRILDGMLSGSFTCVLSAALLDEYRRVMLRDKLRELHGMSPREIDVILTAIVTNAAIRKPKNGLVSAPDPGDDHLWSLSKEAEGSILVTGDRVLIDNPPGFAAVVTPRAFVEAMDETGSKT